jgi:O-antigen/teichoic acid export membrane protein
MKGIKGPALIVLGELLAKSTPFLLVPYLSRLLGVEGFGELASILAMSGIFALAIMLSQDVSLVRSAYNSQKNDTLTGFLISLSIVILIAILLLPILLVIDISVGSWYLGLSIAGLQLTLCLLQLIHKYTFYLVIQSIVLVLNIFITIAVGENDNLTVDNRLKIMAGVNFLAILIISFYIYVRMLPLNFKFECKLYLKALKLRLKFGVLLILSQASNAIKLYFDKILIAKLVGMELLGAYSLSYTFAAASLVVVAAVNKAILPKLYNEFSQTNWNATKFQFQSLSLGGLAFACSLTFFLIPEGFYFYLFGNYVDNISFMVAIFVGSIAIYIPCVLFNDYLMFTGKASVISWISLISAGIFLLLVAGICLSDIPGYFLPAALLICNVVTLVILLIYIQYLSRVKA